MTDEVKFRMGNRVLNFNNGFTGIVLGRTHYANGCVQYLVKPPVGKDGQNVEGLWIDEQDLELVDAAFEDRYAVPTTVGGAIRRAGGPSRAEHERAR